MSVLSFQKSCPHGIRTRTFESQSLAHYRYTRGQYKRRRQDLNLYAGWPDVSAFEAGAVPVEPLRLIALATGFEPVNPVTQVNWLAVSCNRPTLPSEQIWYSFWKPINSSYDFLKRISAVNIQKNICTFTVLLTGLEPAFVRFRRALPIH